MKTLKCIFEDGPRATVVPFSGVANPKTGGPFSGIAVHGSEGSIIGFYQLQNPEGPEPYRYVFEAKDDD